MLLQQLLAFKATPIEEKVHKSLLASRYHMGSEDFEEAVGEIADRLRDALSMLEAGAWTDWMQATDENFRGVDAKNKSKEIITLLKSAQSKFDALYDDMAEASE